MNETLNTIRSLRTIHGNFSKRDLSQEDLQTILDATVCAANASARQSYSIVVVEDRGVMKTLGYEGSKALIFCVDYNRIRDTADFIRKPFHSQEIVSFITGFVDTVLAAQTAAIAAKSLRIDSMFTNCIHRLRLQDVYDLLHLPEENCFPVIELLLGYPQQEPEYQKGRLSGKGIVHYGQYRRLSQKELQEVVAEYDDKDKHIGLISDWEKLGFTHYLDWFYEKWSGKIPDEKQQEFYQALTAAGFLCRDIV
jgi:FMN reductase [NAD(P)H]